MYTTCAVKGNIFWNYFKRYLSCKRSKLLIRWQKAVDWVQQFFCYCFLNKKSVSEWVNVSIKKTLYLFASFQYIIWSFQFTPTVTRLIQCYKSLAPDPRFKTQHSYWQKTGNLNYFCISSVQCCMSSITDNITSSLTFVIHLFNSIISFSFADQKQ